MKICEFGFQRSRSEAFCTGLFAQALSLSPEFSSLFLHKLGYESAFKIGRVVCERQIDNAPRRPDIWLTLHEEADATSKPHLLLLESKTVSGETNSQLSDYGAYVDRINSGGESGYCSARLALLSTFKDMPVSREPDFRISWNEVIALMGELRNGDSFERRYFEQICEHLSGVCAIPAPRGDAHQFELMLWELAKDRSWISYRKPRVQPALYVDENDAWISRRRTESRRQKTLVIVDLNPPKLNDLSEAWLGDWIGDKELLDRLRGEVWRNRFNVDGLKSSLEKLLRLVDECRRIGDSNSLLDVT